MISKHSVGVALVVLAVGCGGGGTAAGGGGGGTAAAGGGTSAAGGGTAATGGGTSGTGGGSADAGAPIVTQAIGAAGGMITVTASDSAALAGTTLVFPAGALSADVVITLTPSTTVIATGGAKAAGPVVDFEPSGTMFSVPITVTLPYTLPTGATTSALVAKIVEADSTVNTATVTNADGGFASFQLSGFSLGGFIIPTSLACNSNPDCPTGQVCVSGHCGG